MLTSNTNKEIPLSGVQDLLPEYQLYPLNVSPEDVGHKAVARLRVYVFCCHKETGVYLFDLYEVYAKIKSHMAHYVKTQCKDYFAASELQSKIHLEAIANSRKLGDPCHNWCSKSYLWVSYLGDG